MNKQISQISSIIVLSILAIILVVLILKDNNTENFSAHRHQKYGLYPKNKPFDISALDFATLASKVNTHTNRYPGAGTMSWENDSVLRNKRLMPIMNLLYSRACRPPLISKMGGYAIYNEQNEMLPVEGN